MQQLQSAMIKGIRIIRNFLLDMRYGGFLGLNLGVYDVFRRRGAKDSSAGEFTYNPYHWLACLNNADVEFLEYAFKDRVKASDVLVDVGCGRGRAISWWLDQGYRNQIIGLELDPDTAERTRRRLRKYKNVTIITGDAAQNIPANGTLFFLNNPFGEPIMKAFKDRLTEISIEPKNITMLYYNPKQIHVFEKDPVWNIQIEETPGNAAAPFHPLAIITMKQ